MLKNKRNQIIKFLTEDLPVIGIDVIIGGLKAAQKIGEKTTKMIASGYFPFPDFIVEKAKKKLESQEDLYHLSDPEYCWSKPDNEEKIVEEKATDSSTDSHQPAVQPETKKTEEEKAERKEKTIKLKTAKKIKKKTSSKIKTGVKRKKLSETAPDKSQQDTKET